MAECQADLGAEWSANEATLRLFSHARYFSWGGGVVGEWEGAPIRIKCFSCRACVTQVKRDTCRRCQHCTCSSRRGSIMPPPPEQQQGRQMGGGSGYSCCCCCRAVEPEGGNREARGNCTVITTQRHRPPPSQKKTKTKPNKSPGDKTPQDAEFQIDLMKCFNCSHF